MNPLLVLFFTAIFIEDFIFRDGALLKYLFYSVLIYWVFYLFVNKSNHHSPSRKLLLASYSQSYDPTIYAKMELRTEKAKEFIKKIESETGKKISLTLFFTKMAAQVIKKYPEFNQSLRFGTMYKKKTIDLSLLVDIGGKDLAFVTLRDIPNKTLSQLSDALVPRANKLKQEKDESFKKDVALLANLPSYFIALLLEINGFFSNLGITSKALSSEGNKFGSMLISSVGSLKLSDAYAPLCPFTYTSCVATVCSTKKKKTLHKDGSITEEEFLPVNMAIDHRFIDGAIGAKMIRECKKLFENPELIENY